MMEEEQVLGTETVLSLLLDLVATIDLRFKVLSFIKRLSNLNFRLK